MVLRALKLNKLITDRVVNKKHENIAPGNLTLKVGVEGLKSQMDS
jgi:hypothetical protein